MYKGLIKAHTQMHARIDYIASNNYSPHPSIAGTLSKVAEIPINA